MNELYHYGMPKRSGRYPYGSGDRPYQGIERKSVQINEKRLKKYKKYRDRLAHVKIDNNTEGKMLVKNGRLVGLVNVEQKEDGIKWIQGIEVFGVNKGKGYGKELLDYAVKRMGATNLSVRKTNKIALNMYKSYGFKTYESTDYMDFMKI